MGFVNTFTGLSETREKTCGQKDRTTKKGLLLSPASLADYFRVSE
jgi:hypothetical protein